MKYLRIDRYNPSAGNPSRAAWVLAAGVMALLIGGCQGYGPIDQQVAMENTFWRPIKVPPRSPHGEPIIGASRISNHGLLPDVGPSNRPGHYAFSIPPTITSLRKITPTRSEYLLYWGTLRDSSRPLITMIIAKHAIWMAKENSAFRITGKREFVLNNLEATQISGYHHRHPFTELVVKRWLTPGSVLDALAIVRSSAQRHAALKILDTIRWVPAKHD